MPADPCCCRCGRPLADCDDGEVLAQVTAAGLVGWCCVVSPAPVPGEKATTFAQQAEIDYRSRVKTLQASGLTARDIGLRTGLTTAQVYALIGVRRKAVADAR